MWQRLVVAIPVIWLTATAVSASSPANFDEIESLAQAGNVAAQAYMGLAHDLGVGTPQDSEAAAGWYRLAADQGNPDAQLYLGAAYLNGRGVQQDYEQALLWLDLASKRLLGEDRVACETLLNQALWDATPSQLASAERARSAWRSRAADHSLVAKASTRSLSRRLRYLATLSDQ